VTHSYRTGDFLNAQEFPRLPEEMIGGIIINMPLINIAADLDKQLAVTHLLDDNYLASYLE
jgi:hypothetical protein